MLQLSQCQLQRFCKADWLSPQLVEIVFSGKSKTRSQFSYALSFRPLKPEQVAEDAPYISNFSTVKGFSRGKYIYFIGSALQPYEPLINANLGVENRTNSKITRYHFMYYVFLFVVSTLYLLLLRFTDLFRYFLAFSRVCSSDATNALESRMDLAIDCGFEGPLNNYSFLIMDICNEYKESLHILWHYFNSFGWLILIRSC